MDVLEPEMVWVNGRRYRFCDSNSWTNQEKNVPYEEDYQVELDDLTNEACEAGILIEENGNGKYQHTFSVPKAVHGFIIGYKGDIVRKLETETRTSIKIPKKDSNGDEITIIGITRGDIISCRQRIDLIVENSRKKMPFTHFISIPLNKAEMIRNFEELKKGILELQQTNSGISEDIFVNSHRLHLTIGMLLLLDGKEMKEADDALHECVGDVVKPMLRNTKTPVKIKIQGLDCMNDDSTKVSVLYAKLGSNEILQDIANKIFAFFLEKGLTRTQYTKDVKLHMTVMKTSKLIPKDPKKRGGRSGGGGARGKTFFDAKKLLTEFEDYNFGTVDLEAIQICERGNEDANDYYKIISEIKL